MNKDIMNARTSCMMYVIMADSPGDGALMSLAGEEVEGLLNFRLGEGGGGS